LFDGVVIRTHNDYSNKKHSNADPLGQFDRLIEKNISADDGNEDTQHEKDIQHHICTFLDRNQPGYHKDSSRDAGKCTD